MSGIIELPPPPPPRERPGAPAPRKPRPAARARIVAGALSVLAFFGLATGMAVGATDTSADPTPVGDRVSGGSSALAPWPPALPGAPGSGGAPTTSTHAS